jgi:hypothetical protein
VQSGFDWLFTSQQKIPEKTWLSSVGYSYSPTDWLEIGAYFQEGFVFRKLDTKKLMLDQNSRYWMAGLSFSLTY